MTNKIQYIPLSQILSHVLQRDLSFTPKEASGIPTVEASAIASYLVTNRLLSREQFDSLRIQEKTNKLDEYEPLYHFMCLATFDKDMQSLHYGRRDAEVIYNYFINNKIMTVEEVHKLDRMILDNLSAIADEIDSSEQGMDAKKTGFPFEC